MNCASQYHSPAKCINLYIQSYKSDHIDRQKELDTCLRINRLNPFVNVIEITDLKRFTFGDFMDYIRPFSDDDTISIFCNSDIILDDTIRLALMMSPDDVYCLSRYEGLNIEENDKLDKSSIRLSMNIESSDTWIFRGHIKEVDDIDFQLGMWGCDGAFANRLTMTGYKIHNPSHFIHTHHIHKSNIRNNQFPSAPKPWSTMPHSVLGWSFSDHPSMYDPKHNNRNVVSFCLYGGNPLYIQNALARILEYKNYLKGEWDIHLSISIDVPEMYRMKLISMVDSYDMRPPSKESIGTLWRGLAVGSVVLIRDIDAKISPREIEALGVWLDSDYGYCTFRDHEGHKSPIMAGAISVKDQVNVRTINSIYRVELNEKSSSTFVYGDDEKFLRDKVYPIIMNSCMDFSSIGKRYNFVCNMELPERKSPIDVIGDGIGKYDLMHDSGDIISNKIYSDDFEELIRISKYWCRTMRTPAWVSFSSIVDEYKDFYEPVSKMWNNFGYKVFYTEIGDEMSIELNDRGIILKLYSNENIHQFDSNYNRNFSWKAQIARLYAAKFISGKMLITDLDSLPLQADYFDSLVSLSTRNNIAISRRDPYGNGKYCMMWLVAEADVFESVFNCPPTFDEFCDAYTASYAESFIADEQYLTDAINSSGVSLSFMDNVPVNRVDRINWVYDKVSLRLGLYTDSHLLKPHAQYRDQIDKLIHDRWND